VAVAGESEWREEAVDVESGWTDGAAFAALSAPALVPETSEQAERKGSRRKDRK
jgi:hypothetical protein